MEWELSLPEVAAIADSSRKNAVWMMSHPQGCIECIKDAIALYEFARLEISRRTGRAFEGWIGE